MLQGGGYGIVAGLAEGIRVKGQRQSCSLQCLGIGSESKSRLCWEASFPLSNSGAPTTISCRLHDTTGQTEVESILKRSRSPANQKAAEFCWIFKLSLATGQGHATRSRALVEGTSVRDSHPWVIDKANTWRSRDWRSRTSSRMAG